MGKKPHKIQPQPPRDTSVLHKPLPREQSERTGLWARGFTERIITTQKDRRWGQVKGLTRSRSSCVTSNCPRDFARVTAQAPVLRSYSAHAGAGVRSRDGPVPPRWAPKTRRGGPVSTQTDVSFSTGKTRARRATGKDGKSEQGGEGWVLERGDGRKTLS